tara:strand:+ start:881 stop:1330 length:450 start_codon:yes stop_codon:yes gene_type:complete
MVKLLSILLLFILSGCTPHFYETKALKVNAKGIKVIASGELNENCIDSSEIPSIYELRREFYAIEFSVSALQLGMRFIQPEVDGYAFSSPELKVNEPYVTRLDAEYTHYISTLEARDITILILEQDKEIGSEVLSISVEGCKAVLIEAI